MAKARLIVAFDCRLKGDVDVKQCTSYFYFMYLDSFFMLVWVVV